MIHENVKLLLPNEVCYTMKCKEDNHVSHHFTETNGNARRPFLRPRLLFTCDDVAMRRQGQRKIF